MHSSRHTADLTSYPARQDESALLLEWANDPEVRAASGNRPRIKKADHQKWFSRILQDPRSRLLMIKQADQVVGVVRVIHIDTYHEVSWTVAPEFRHRGIGRKMVAMVTADLDGPLRATVERSNAASIKVARTAGFVLYKEKNGILYYRRS